ncbi:hypothetical protein H9633_10160 [Microbacterium sp. Re1]|uniref:Uncharacterized protein n=1 Tax=Microbacterium commune TaxID=2762219 RepID=A0ABR8W6J8_9MICO|nr:hypothetical protein [Microbacterium commune]MBD8012660.1 hypothetical protein [Microbacterium commune]
MTNEDLTPYRDQLAAERGISNEDRDLLMTGDTEEWLLQQADLLAPLPDLTKNNRAPKEGQRVDRADPEPTMREFVQELIHGPNNDPLSY